MEPYIDGLTSLGLTSYEAKCYVALLGKNELTAAEVAKIAGIPRSKVYETLEKLLHKGLCNYIPDAVVKYRASDPEILNDSVEEKLSKIKEKITREETEYKATLNLKKELIGNLSEIFEGGQENTDPLHYIEVIKEFDQVNKKFIQLLNATREEILALTTSRIRTPNLSESRRKYLELKLKAQTDVVIKTLKRGIKIRSIFELSANPSENWVPFKDFDTTSKLGHEIRLLPDVPFQMTIFDTKTIMFNLADPISGTLASTNQVIIHQSLARGQKMLFDMFWEKAEDYREFRKRIKID